MRETDVKTTNRTSLGDSYTTLKVYRLTYTAPQWDTAGVIFTTCCDPEVRTEDPNMIAELNKLRLNSTIETIVVSIITVTEQQVLDNLNHDNWGFSAKLARGDARIVFVRSRRDSVIVRRFDAQPVGDSNWYAITGHQVDKYLNSDQ